MDSSKGMKLSELSKFALALNSPQAVKPGTPGQKGRRKQHQELAKRLRVAAFSGSGSLARDNAQELSAIRSVEELEIDFSKALNIMRGDLSIIQGEVYRAFPRAPHLSDIPLILRRLDCMDRRIYDLKVYEADTFMRFQGHTNIISLYSYWSEMPTNQYTFKMLVLLEEEALGGSLRAVLDRGQDFSYRRLLKWTCDIAKGLIAFHNCNIIHGRVKPSNVFLDSNGNALLGMMGKVELDSARQTHQLFSKVLIGQAIPHTLVYWAPELLRLEKYGKATDLWAFGVTLFQLATRGALPFNAEDELSFREESLVGNVDVSKLDEYPRLQTVVDNLLQASPDDRWTAHQVLAFVQQEFAVHAQRIWRGFVQHRKYLEDRWRIILIQAWVRGRLQRIRFKKMRDTIRYESAVKIQSAHRGHSERQKFLNIKKLFLKCQARVLARQCRESFLQYRQCVLTCQAQARKYISQRWFDRVREGRAVLESKLRTLEAMVLKFKEEGSEYSHMFAEGTLPRALQYLGSFEDYELSLPPELVGGPSQMALPRLRTAEDRISQLEEEVNRMKEKVVDAEKSYEQDKQSEEQLKKELGVKYPEYGPMVEALKRNMKRVAELCEQAEPLPIGVQHPYQYSKWDAVHEPHNVVENVLEDNDSVYRTVAPVVDMTLFNGEICFVSQVEIEPGEPGPANVEVYTSNVPEKWTLASMHKCTREPRQSFQLPAEPLCRYLRILFKNNVRGGNIVSVKRVRVMGLVKEG